MCRYVWVSRMSHQLSSQVVGWSRLSVVIQCLWGLTVLASERQYSKLRERGNRWMASAVAEDGARATLSENRYKTAGGGVVRDSEQSESM